MQVPNQNMHYKAPKNPSLLEYGLLRLKVASSDAVLEKEGNVESCITILYTSQHANAYNVFLHPYLCIFLCKNKYNSMYSVGLDVLHRQEVYI